jgi:predicted nucleotidyltransferase
MKERVSVDQKIRSYLIRLTDEYPKIESVWLFGSRANGTYSDDSDWDFFVFADKNILNKLRGDSSLNDPKIDLLVVYDGNNFEAPCQERGRENDPPKQGSLTGGFHSWKWKQISETEAEYTEVRDIEGSARQEFEQKKAMRIWPFEKKGGD